VQNLVIRPRWIALSAIIVAAVLAISASTGLAFQSTPSSPGFGRGEFGNNNRQPACNQIASGGGQFGGSPPLDPLNAVANALKLAPATLQSDLASGTSLSQIITQQGMTADQVVRAVVAQDKTQLDQQVASGQITRDQENATLAVVQTSINQAIAGQAPLTGTVTRQGSFARGGTANGQTGQSSQGRGFNSCGG
jgi:hypothetical protein